MLLAPKVQDKFPAVDFKTTVYPRLDYKILEPESKDVLFTMVHGFVHNKNRMHQQERVQDPYCLLPECQGKIEDLEHLFCSCCLVAEAWTWLHSKLLEILPATEPGVAQATTNLEFLTLQFPVDTMDQECSWLLANYCSIVVSTVTGRKSKLGVQVLAGKLRTRLQRLQGRAVIQPQLFNI